MDRVCVSLLEFIFNYFYCSVFTSFFALSCQGVTQRDDFIVIIDVDLNCLWIVLYDNDDILYEMILMMPQRAYWYIYLYDDV